MTSPARNFSIRLGEPERARIVALAAAAGTGPLCPTPTAVMREALDLGLRQLEGAFSAIEDVRRLDQPAKETAHE